MDDDVHLATLFPSESPPPDDGFRYGPLRLSIPSKKGKAITLLADQIFNPALVFAEQIDAGLIQVKGRSICELGAGTGLPGIYAFVKGASAVVLTEYPDENILDCLWENVHRNIGAEYIWKDTRPPHRWCTVKGHDWGTDTKELKSLVPTYDILFLADLLWYSSGHAALLDSVVALLGPEGEAWIGCGEYTTLETCEGFLSSAEKRGLNSQRIFLSDEWESSDTTSLLNLRERKRRVWIWKMQWRK